MSRSDLRILPKSVSGSSGSLKSASSKKDLSLNGENVMVSVRMRPLNDVELRLNQKHCWDVVDGPAGTISMNAEFREKLRKPMSPEYVYDQVFVGSDNGQVYDTAVSELVKSSMEGYNGVVFAYGETASGKTYTIKGHAENPGVIPLAISDIFDYIKETKAKREFLLRVSYMEIYNESINDLLAPENSDLKIHEDKHRGTYVSPLKEEIVTSYDQVLEVIRRGEDNRHVSATDYNEKSSRSHAIFQIVIESREHVAGSPGLAKASKMRTGPSSGMKSAGVPVRISTLNLIDLAGSEKASSSAERRREGAYINKSLLTLGTVISKLTEEKASHIPYRDSKLTRILQPALQGNSRVSVICTISPAMNNIDETGNTLKFAQRIKKVVTKAATNEVMDDKALLQKYRSEIDELKTKLHDLTDKENESVQLAAEKLRLEEELHQQQLVRTALKERIDHLTKLILTSSSINSGPFSPKPDEFPRKNSAVNRLSLAMPSPNPSALDSSAVEDLQKMQEKYKTVAEQNEALVKEIKKRDEKISDLEEEISNMKSQLDASRMRKSEGDLVIAAELANVKNQLLKEKARTEELFRELESLRSKSSKPENYRSETPFVDLSNINTTSLSGEKVELDPDKFLEMEHIIQEYKERIAEIEKEKQSLQLLTSQLKQRLDTSDKYLERNNGSPVSPSAIYSQYRGDTFSSDLGSNTSSHLRENGSPTINRKPSEAQQLLSTLLSTPPRERAISNASAPLTPPQTSHRTEFLLREIEQNLDREKRLRSKTIDRMATLETELALAKTEMSVRSSMEDIDKALSELSSQRPSVSSSLSLSRRASNGDKLE